MEKKFKTKNERHAHDDEKRRQSLQKKLKEQQSQKELIKNALSDSAKPKKIVFNDEELQATENGIDEDVHCNGYVTHNDSMEKPPLFEESDDDQEENYEIKIKSQFEGKKGRKLLNLQSSYNNDERFRLDERFKDDGSDEDGKLVTNKHSNERNYPEEGSNDVEEEKKKQLKVLETVLGKPIKPAVETEKKTEESCISMVRFDASNKDHKRLENDIRGEVEDEPVKKKKKKKEKLTREEKRKRKKEEQESGKQKNIIQPTNEEKFYEISDEFKVSLKNRKNEGGQFSLLAAYSKKPESDHEEEHMETEDVDDNQTWHENEVDDVDKIVDSRQRTNEETKEVVKVRGIAKEKFFFTPDDPRIEEGLTFINMKNSEEAGKAIENYDETRRGIREVLRLRWQRHRHVNNPFKKKIGGLNAQKRHFNNNRKQFGKGVTRRR